MARRLLSLILLAFLVLPWGCATSGSPGGGVIFISTQEEVRIGAQAARQIEKKYPVLRDSPVADYVEEVGQRLARVCDRHDITYHFKVLVSKEVNAFSLPGGWVYIFTGMLEKLDNTAQLAGVLGHEIGHIVARHAVKRLQIALGVGILYSIFLGRQGDPLTQNAVKFLINIAMSGYSRANEREADHLGIIYEYRAGYNPRGIIQVMEMIRGIHHGKISSWQKFLMDHPPPQERIRLLEGYLKQLPPEALHYPFYTKEYHREVLEPLKELPYPERREEREYYSPRHRRYSPGPRWSP